MLSTVPARKDASNQPAQPTQGCSTSLLVGPASPERGVPGRAGRPSIWWRVARPHWTPADATSAHDPDCAVALVFEVEAQPDRPARRLSEVILQRKSDFSEERRLDLHVFHSSGACADSEFVLFEQVTEPVPVD